MAYKISGITTSPATIILLNPTTFDTINSVAADGSYEFPILLNANDVHVIAIKSDGEIKAYGDVTPVSHTYTSSYDRAVWISPEGDKDLIQYSKMSVPESAVTFWDLGPDRGWAGACSNGTGQRAVIGGGSEGSYYKADLYYIAMNSTGIASSFGSLTQARASLSGTSNHTNNMGVYMGGHTGSIVNTIDYITISPGTGNATDFGDLTTTCRYAATFSNGVNDRGIRAGGEGTGNNVIDYITISTPSVATDFGDLQQGRNQIGGTSNLTGNVGIIHTATFTFPASFMQKINILSTGNATSYGSLTRCEGNYASTSNGTLNRGFTRGSTYIDYYPIKADGGNATAWVSGQTSFVSHAATSNA